MEQTRSLITSTAGGFRRLQAKQSPLHCRGGSADKIKAGWMSRRLQLKSKKKTTRPSGSLFSFPFPSKIVFLATWPGSNLVSLDFVCRKSDCG